MNEKKNKKIWGKKKCLNQWKKKHDFSEQRNLYK